MKILVRDGGFFAGLPRMARAALMGLGSTTVKLVSPAVNRENLDALLRLLEPGEVRVVIDKTYPLDQAADAAGGAAPSRWSRRRTLTRR